MFKPAPTFAEDRENTFWFAESTNPDQVIARWREMAVEADVNPTRQEEIIAQWKSGEFAFTLKPLS